MQTYSFQPDLTKSYKILQDTIIILSDEVDAHSVQDVIINLLPGAFQILGTKVKLMVITVMIYNNIAYWDLIFEYPKENYNPSNLLTHIFNEAIELDDSFDHYQEGGNGLHKISFKVG